MKGSPFGVLFWALALALILCPLAFAEPDSSDSEKKAEILLHFEASDDRLHTLDGPWEFYSFQGASLHLQTDMSPEPDPTSWRLQSKHDYKPFSLSKFTGGSGEGLVMLRSKLRLTEVPENLDLYITTAASAMWVWVNDKLIFKQGKVGYNKETEIPSRKYGSVSLIPSETYEVVVLISNFNHRSGGLLRPFVLGSRSAIWSLDRKNLLTIAFIMGSVLIVAIYHLALYLYRPSDRVNLYLVLVCLGILVRSFNTGNPRMILELMANIDFHFSFRLEYIGFVSSVGAFTWYYVASFPSLIHPLIKWLTTVVCGVYILLIMFTSTQFFTGLLPYFQVYIVFLMCSGLLLLIPALKQRLPGAIEFSIGVCLFLSFGLLEIGMHFRSLYYPVSFFGAFCLVLSQSIALASRFAQKFSELSYYESQTRHAYGQIQKVFYPHQLQSMQNGLPMESTMPLGSGRAAVICFDLVASSSMPLDNESRKEFLRSLFERCYVIMMENYSVQPLASNAFRIKEMGDGFLCSVGFPFANPNPENNETTAVKLALRFIQVLSNLNKEMALEKPIYCGIGIATGDIEGFFPESGIKEYDLIGRPLILATRYEKARNQLFKNFPIQSVVVLQQAVYESLDSRMQERFASFKLSDGSYRIRDDQQAQAFYYAFMQEEVVSQVDEAS